MAEPDLGIKRTDAFLDLIRTVENKGVTGPDIYRRSFGKNHYFMNMSDHPRKIYVSGHHRSDAAGAYGITSQTFDWVKGKVHVHDFSPASQDKIARWLVQYKGAATYITHGDFHSAYSLLNGTWSSLSGGIAQEITAEDADRFINGQVSPETGVPLPDPTSRREPGRDRYGSRQRIFAPGAHLRRDAVRDDKHL